MRVAAWTFDALYGRDSEFLDKLAGLGQNFVGQVPCDMTGWLQEPRVLLRPTPQQMRKPGQKQSFPRLARKAIPACEVRNLVKYSPVLRKQAWQRFRIKDGEQGPVVWEVKHALFYRKQHHGLPSHAHTLIVARNVLDRMGTTGQPPERGAQHVNVATDDLLKVLRDEYLRPMKASGRNSTFKLVQAPFGGGKTHFLHCLRELAWTEGFATALVGLSPKECPFDRPVSIYREVARRIELPVEELDAEPSQGLDRVLRLIAEQRVEESGREAFLAWLRSEFARASIESRAFGRGIKHLLRTGILLEESDLPIHIFLGNAKHRAGSRDLSFNFFHIPLQFLQISSSSNNFK